MSKFDCFNNFFIIKVKKYNLDDAINSYGNYVKDIDITELIIKAKELYQNGGNV